MRKLLLALVVLAGLSSLSASDDVHGPVVIATETITASTSSSSPIVVTIPTTDSGYIVTMHAAVHGDQSTGTSSVLAEADYTNTLGSSTPGRAAISASSGRVTENITFAMVKGGSNLIFFTTYSAGDSNDAYDVTFTFIKQ